MKKIIDTHAHLFKSYYKDQFNEVLEKSVDELFIMINIGFNKETIKEVIEISKNQKKFYSVIGFHPHDIDEYNDESKEELEKLLKNEKIFAIGEIGLDYHYEPFDKEKQKKVFIDQIELAKKYNLPIVIHARDSLDDLYLIIKNYPEQKFLLHSWGSLWEETKKFLDLKNIWFGFNGIITFSNAKYLIDTLKNIPIEKVLFETDAPFLSPVPLRGKKNFPFNVKYVYEYFSKVVEIDEEKLEEIIWENVKNFFNIDL